MEYHPETPAFQQPGLDRHEQQDDEEQGEGDGGAERPVLQDHRLLVERNQDSTRTLDGCPRPAHYRSRAEPGFVCAVRREGPWLITVSMFPMLRFSSLSLLIWPSVWPLFRARPRRRR